MALVIVALGGFGLWCLVKLWLFLEWGWLCLMALGLCDGSVVRGGRGCQCWKFLKALFQKEK
jgi:hypothetical protein